MIIAISETKEIEKIIRQQLIAQSELSSDRVLNGLNDFGEDLDKEVENDIFDAIDAENNTMLFELQLRRSSSDISFTENDDTSKYVSFAVHCVIYGDDSNDIGIKTCARFETENIRLELIDKGVYIEDISEMTSINEFKNGVLWKRVDFFINISCRFDIKSLKSTYDFDFDSASFNIIEKEKLDNVD